MLQTHFSWQTDLKPLSVTNAKNGAIPLSLTPTIHTIHEGVTKQVSGWGGVSLSGTLLRVTGPLPSPCLVLSAALFRGNGVICRTQRVIQGDDNGHVGRHCEVSPAPPCPELCELRGLCRHSYFGPRTCGRGITSRSRRRVSPSHPRNAGREGLPRNHLHGPEGDSGR